MTTNILCVDDDNSVLMALEDIITSFGFECTTTNSGKEALSIIEESQIDLVIIDLVMPAMSGGTLFSRLSMDFPNLPIIFFSANLSDKVVNYGVKTRKSYMQASYRLSFLRKPITGTVLKNHIEVLLSKEGGHVSGEGLINDAPLLDPFWVTLFLESFKDKGPACHESIDALTRNILREENIASLLVNLQEMSRGMPDLNVHELISDMKLIVKALQSKKPAGEESSIKQLKDGMEILERVHTFLKKKVGNKFCSLAGFPSDPFKKWENR